MGPNWSKFQGHEDKLFDFMSKCTLTFAAKKWPDKHHALGAEDLSIQ